MSAVITDIAQVTPDWLTAALYRSGALTSGAVKSLKTEQRGRALVMLEINYSADARGEKPQHLVFKFSRLLEGRFYADLAPEMSHIIGLLRCYDAGYSLENGRSHQLLADLSGSHFDAPEMLPMTLFYAEQITDGLAAVHAHWWQHPRLKTDVGTMAEDTAGELLQAARARFPGFVDYLGDRLSARRRSVYETLLAALPLPAWQQRLTTGQHSTLVHGDAHWWNFMYPRDASRNTICLIDWEGWHINIGVSDLAYTIALECYPEHRSHIEQPLVRRYHQRLQMHGVQGYDWAQCWADYRMAVLYHLLFPVKWYIELSPNIWWPALECTLLAFEDLNCAELL